MDFNHRINLTITGQEIAQRLIDTRNRELALILDLSEQQLIGQPDPTIEPPIWELGHVGWFQDRWILQNLDKRQPSDPKADLLYHSFNIANDARWQLSYPSLGQTVEYITDILDKIISRLAKREPTAEEVYYYNLVLNHEEMHSETMHHIRHTLGYPAPKLTFDNSKPERPLIDENFAFDEIAIPGGEYMLGGLPNQPFIFDNEKWAHPVKIAPFLISSTPVTFGQYQAFVDAGGYLESSFWSAEGWAWLSESGQDGPHFWKKEPERGWIWRWFDQWQPIEENMPMVNVNWYEANAYCRWAGCRLPSEAEWELAASATPMPDGAGFDAQKKWYPWGNQHPSANHANLNSRSGRIIDVRAFPQGDSAFGLRQMIGNVWEWTADTFDAFPGYVIDPYDTYSAPSFGQQKVLRGGCWATRPHVIRNTFRNFYTPDRNNIFAGFRTARSIQYARIDNAVEADQCRRVLYN